MEFEQENSPTEKDIVWPKYGLRESPYSTSPIRLVGILPIEKVFCGRKEEVSFDNGNFTVRLRKEESCETLIKRFLKKTKKEGVIDEVLERKHFKKHSAKKREKALKREMLFKLLNKKERMEQERDDG